MRTSLSCAALVFCMLIQAAWAEAFKIDFDEIPKLVSAKNRHVTGARAMLEASESQTGYLLRSYLPNVELHAGGERFETGPFSARTQPYGEAQVRFNLFNGGRDQLENAARNARLGQSSANFQQAYIEEITKARKSFWGMVYQREVVALLEEALRQNVANLTSANRRIGAGLATETDRIEFEMYRTQLEQDLARSTLGASNAQRILNVLIGNEEQMPLLAIDSVPHQHDDALLTQAFEPAGHRDVVALRANGEAAGANRSLQYRWWMPAVDAYAGYALYTLRERDSLDARDRDDAFVGLRLTINLFDGWQSRTTGRGYSLQADAYEDQAAQTGRELKALFETSKQELNLTHDLIHAAEKSVVLAAKYLARTQAEYARGVKNSPDVFSATEKYIEIKRRYAEVRRDYQLAKTDLLAILGK